MDLADRLWRDRSVFQYRYEEDAAAYVALTRTLETRRPLAGGESEPLALHAFFAGLDPEAFTTVWRDPYAHLWVRLAYALVGAVVRGAELPREAEAYARELGTTEPADVLARHLGELKRLAIGAALVAGSDLELPSPLEAQLPLAIPGTQWSIEGPGGVRIAAVRGGAVLDAGGTALPLRACPVARVGDFELPLQPYGYRVPGLGWMPSAGETDLDYQAGQVPLVERALALVRKHQPETLAQMRAVLRWVAINPIEAMGDDNFVSDSHLPGVFAVLGVPQPYVIASASVHEFHHNRLFFLEDAQPLLAGDGLGTEDEARYYSPWRENPRPLRGILHGVYVYVPEGRFWLAVALDEETDEPTRRLALDRIVRVPLQLELGIAQLERYGRFTEAGKPLFEQLAADARSVIEDIRAAGLPADVPATYVEMDGTIRPKLSEDGGAPITSRGVIREHLARHDLQGQAASA